MSERKKYYEIISNILQREFDCPYNINLGYAELLHSAISGNPKLMIKPKADLWKAELYYLKIFSRDILINGYHSQKDDQNENAYFSMTKQPKECLSST